VFTTALAKHSKSFSLIGWISVGVDRMQRNFEPMRKQVGAWLRSELTDVTAKVVIYEAFVEGKLEAPKRLTRTVHDLYFEPLRFRKHNGSDGSAVVQKGLETNLHIVLALRSKCRFEPDCRDKIRTPFSGIHKTYTSLGAELRQ
jgi:hypothetical protein